MKLHRPSRMATSTPVLAPGTRARAILTALLAALLAEESDAEVAGLDGQLVGFLEGFSPRAPQALVAALYAIEYGPWLWFRVRRRFTSLGRSEQREYLAEFERSRSYLRQRLLHIIRFIATVLFYSQPEREREAGYEPPSIDRSGAGAF